MFAVGLVGHHPRGGWITVNPAGASPGSSSLLGVSCHCQIVFSFPQWTFPSGLPLLLSSPLRFHRQDAEFPPMTALHSLLLGCPPCGPLPPCLTFPSSFNKLGSGSCGGLCGEDKYLLLESQSLTAGQCRENGLWIKPWMGCSIYLSWLSFPMASA